MAYHKRDGEQTQAGPINPAPKLKPPKLVPTMGRNHAAGYGQNQSDCASSDTDLKNATISSLGAALKAAQDDGTGTLDAVIAHGTSAVVGESGMAHLGDVQEGMVSPTAYPTSFGLRPDQCPSKKETPKVPGSIPGGLEASRPVRQPD